MEIKPYVLSVKETATYTSLSASTLYKLIAKGELTPLKVGGKTLFRRADLDAFLNASATQPSRTHGEAGRRALAQARAVAAGIFS